MTEMTPELEPEPAVAEVQVDHKELAGYVRDIPLPGRNKFVTDAVAFLVDNRL